MAPASAVNGGGQAAAATAVLAPPTPPIVSRVFPPQPESPSPASLAARRPSRRTLMFGGFAGLLVIAAAAVLIVTSLGGGPSYSQQARVAFAPVLQANNRMSTALTALTPGASTGAATGAVTATIGAVVSAQRTLGALKPGSSSQQLATTAKSALGSELAYLNAASLVLGNPQSPRLTELGTLGDTAYSQLVLIGSQIPGASASFSGQQTLSTFAANLAQQRAAAAANLAQQHAAAAANLAKHRATASALTAFSNQVDSLLSQSASSFQAINQVFGQMETAAQGGAASITLSQAEASISNVISNRDALVATAGTLPAPTALAGQVRGALVASFDASLTNDTDIQNCLNQPNNGTVAYIFQSCLSSTAADSNAATQAKQNFLALYNQLRQSIGLPSENLQF